MKKIFLIAFAAGMLTTAQAGDTLTVRIDGMHCDNCSRKVRQLLKPEAGVNSIATNIERHTATIVYDKALTSAASLRAKLDATERYKTSAYNASDIIMNGIGLRIDDMHCQKCADRITQRLQKVSGVDSLTFKLDKHYVYVRYDANRTSRADIRAALVQSGYTPCTYYKSDKGAYAYYLLPAEQATEDTQETVLAIDGVGDVTVSPRRKAMAVAYFSDEVTAEQLLAAIQKAGIKATLPKPHECSEEEGKK